MQERINAITSVLDTNKGENIEVYDLREKDYFVDQVVIVSSMGERHTEALLDFLKKDLKGKEQFLNTQKSSEWIVVDLGDILIHLMTPLYRERYHMEEFLNEIGPMH